MKQSMKQSIKLICGVVTLSVIGTGCSSTTDEPTPPGKELRLNINCMLGGNNRATDTSFEGGDRIGLFAVKTGLNMQPAGNILTNIPFGYDGLEWTADTPAYWDAGVYDIYAYYPYTSKIEDTEDFSFSVQSDQSTHAGYTLSDFMWASARDVEASSDAVPLTFSHMLSKVIVVLEKGDEYEGEIPEDSEVYILSTATTASIDLSSGEASAALYSPTETIKCRKVAANTYEGIVVPQNITTRLPLIEVVSAGVSDMMEGKVSFKPGYSQRIVITLSRNPEQTKIEIGGSIGGWD